MYILRFFFVGQNAWHERTFTLICIRFLYRFSANTYQQFHFAHFSTHTHPLCDHLPSNVNNINSQYDLSLRDDNVDMYYD